MATAPIYVIGVFLYILDSENGIPAGNEESGDGRKD